MSYSRMKTIQIYRTVLKKHFALISSKRFSDGKATVAILVIVNIALERQQLIDG